MSCCLIASLTVTLIKKVISRFISGHHICIPASRKVLNKKTVCLKLPATSAYILLPKLNHKTTLATKEKKMKLLLWVTVCQYSHSIILKEGKRDIGAVFVIVCMSHTPSMETFVASLFQRFMEQLQCFALY